ncbi:hypothetical protein [Terriglobus aquaticus]|uniref:Uncharacterized protein n=1 Tax=Terriglobus aquaticus TaxID=940139 RepID=A0ABW9KEZ0_9BACT|nr:hypothetical protein [Terriglobus aquaticus]
MASTLKSLFTTENGVSKPIDARTHGIIDYCHAGLFATVALLCWKKNRNAALTAAGTSAFILVQSLLTDYPLGKKRVIPFATHGAMDAGFAALSFAAPRLFGFSGTKAGLFFQSNSVLESTAVALTDWDSDHARAEEDR